MSNIKHSDNLTHDYVAAWKTKWDMTRGFILKDWSVIREAMTRQWDEPIKHHSESDRR